MIHVHQADTLEEARAYLANFATRHTILSSRINANIIDDFEIIIEYK